MIFFEINDEKPFVPKYQWGKGIVVVSAQTSIGCPEVWVDREAMAARARVRGLGRDGGAPSKISSAEPEHTP